MYYWPIYQTYIFAANVRNKYGTWKIYILPKGLDKMLRQINNIQSTLIENAIYTLLWLVLFFFPILILGSIGNLSWERLVLEWVRLVPFLLFFAVHNCMLMPELLMKRRVVLYINGVVVCMILISMLFPLCRELQFMILPDEPPRPLHRGLFFIKNFYSTVFFMILILVFNLLLKSFFVQQQKLRMEELKGKESIQTELNFLKTQISPHFFMNTLNNIHALIDYEPEIAKETVISLSRLMRHILYDSQSRRVSVRNEMNFIKSYVELMKLKTSDKVLITCNIPDVFPEKKLPPLIFTSLIENAFKHGISLKEKSYISIDFSFPDTEHMECKIVNSNHHICNTERRKGIGLKNTKRRLDIEFPMAYTLDITNNEKEYKVTLNIPI